ncbi:hypothetical protein BR93DRAFT_942002 [Coniochaeta sp. PMI_546]|nr:hypothetical protein BR93DRAFT_942002 [Coniochaeta sp. PMI_546]
MTPVYDTPNQAASGATLSARLAKKPISAGRRLQNRKAQKAYHEDFGDFGLCDSPIIHTPDHIESSSVSSPTRMLSLQFQHAASYQSPMHTKETSFRPSPKPAHPKSIYIYRPSGKQVSITPRVVRDYLMSLPKITQRHLHGLAKGGDFSFVDIIQSLMQVACDANHTPRRLETLPPVIQASVEPVTYSPYRNVLRIARFSYFAALFANFSSLGFEFSSFLDENSVSPFCGHADGDANESNFPDSLRPLLSQRTISHHPYIDSLPFPSFRRRALAALSTEPPLLDEDDLCIDLMLNDGLVCWGSAGDNGSDYGTPWDSHSWEAKEWFLRKWWWLVGGQDGELYHSSRWWASQRGEKVSLHAS